LLNRFIPFHDFLQLLIESQSSTSETQKTYDNGIDKAIRDSGFDPLRVDRLEHNNKICDVIVAEIRKSAFLVADFTGQRLGVYFEAGFAMGLGIPVIWLCRKDHLESTHFDTRQYNYLVLESESELHEKLLNRINATIPL
jgi:nucleoside 2-deoxyribosyltransferase